MDDAALVDALTRHLDGADPADVVDAPLDELLAGLIEGRLLDDERDRAVELLAAHPALRTVFARTAQAVAPDAAPQDARGTGAGKAPWIWTLATAAAGVLLFFFGGTWWAGPGARSDGTLQMEVAALTRATPAIFEGFEPFDTDLPSPTSPDLQRGGLRPLAPRGLVATGRPTLRWESPLAEGRYRVRVRAEDGSVPWEAEVAGTEVAWPADVPALRAGARFVWHVTSVDAAMVLTGAQAFSVLDAERAARYEDGLARIQDRPTHNAVVAAHWALHFGLRADAEAHLADAPPGPDADALRAWLRPVSSD